MKYKGYEIQIDKENDKITMILLSNSVEQAAFNFDHFSITPDDDDDIIEAMIQEWIDDQEEIRK